MMATAKPATTPPAQRAKILVEALPYIRTFREKRVLIKYGGSAMTDNRLKGDFAEDVALISFV
jgi:acetylglutamate kinase